LLFKQLPRFLGEEGILGLAVAFEVRSEKVHIRLVALGAAANGIVEDDLDRSQQIFG
jgi:hypothetical protein